MEQIVNLINMSILLVLGVVLYLILTATLLPKIVKTYCTIKKSTDRGLKKYVYPEGRGIVYEPHPSVRKYVPTYILFTNDGCKYLKCKLDISVKQMAYSVVMFNRKNRVVDVIDVLEKVNASGETSPVLLDPRTSYIRLVPTCVNGKYFNQKSIICCRLWRLFIYGFVMWILSFLQMAVMTAAIRWCNDRWFHLDLAADISVGSMIFSALCIGVAMSVIVFLYNRKKGVRWTI